MASKQSYDGFEVGLDDPYASSGVLTPTQLWNNVANFFQGAEESSRAMEKTYDLPDLRGFVSRLTSPEHASALFGRVGTLDQSKIPSRSFAQFLLRHKFSLARVLTPLLNDLLPSQSTLDTTQVCKHLIQFYGYHTEKLALSVARCIIFEEVRLQTDAGTLFRANSTATTYMASFAREIGKSYLEKTLSPIVKKIISDVKKNTFFEVDPLKVNKASEVKINSKNLEKLVRSVVKAIIKSTSTLPLCALLLAIDPFTEVNSGIRELCAFLRESISKRFPESKYVVVGGFFFLRFFCPAFLNPQSFMDLGGEALTPPVRRSILLVCKFIQTMANAQNFNKEPYMLPFNPLLEELTPEIHRWFDVIATIPSEQSSERAGFANPVTIDVFLHSLKELHSFHAQHLKRLVEVLVNMKEDEEETSHSYFDETQLIPFLSDLASLSDLPDFLPEDKVRQESYSWEEESSQSSGPLPEALPPDVKRKSGLPFKKSKSIPIPVHEGAKERRKSGISTSASLQPSQASPSLGKKWSLKNIMGGGQKSKSHSADFSHSEGHDQTSSHRRLASTSPLKTTGSPLDELSAKLGVSPRYSLPSLPGLRKSNSGTSFFGRQRADSRGTADSPKHNPMSRSASSLPSSERDHERERWPLSQRSTRETEERSTEYKVSSGDEDDDRDQRSQYPDDAPEEDTESEFPPQALFTPSSIVAILESKTKSQSQRLSGTWKISDTAASGQESSELELSASLHDDS